MVFRLSVGLILLLCALVPPLLNRQMPNPARIARKSSAVSADAIDPSADGKFVSITGGLVSAETVGDPLFSMSGNYILLQRDVEMYSWIELDSISYHSEDSESPAGDGDGRAGNSREKIAVKKTYRLEWADDFQGVDMARRPEQYANPPSSVQTERFLAEEVALGAYRLDPETLRFSCLSPLPITAEAFAASDRGRLEEGYIFVGGGSLRKPKLGDLRIRYKVVESGALVTLFGRLSGDAVGPYIHEGGMRFYRALAGSRKEALAQMDAEHWVDVWIAWMFRAARLVELDDHEFFRQPSAEVRHERVEEMAEERLIVTVFTWALRVMGLFVLWFGLYHFIEPISARIASTLMMDPPGRPRFGLYTLILALILSSTLWWL